MEPVFTAYIDESGDQGFEFREPQHMGSSRWFIISAVVTKTSQKAIIRKNLDDLRAELNMQSNQIIHFSKLNHAQRVLATDRISRMPLRIVSVLVHKPDLANPETFRDEGYRLYFFTLRLLLERVSWLCRDHEQEGRCKLIFEHCKSLRYDDLDQYIQRLKTKNTKIDWDSIKTDKLFVENKKSIAALQLADCSASSFQWALAEKHKFTEHRFAKNLKPVVYCNGLNYRSYGLKFLCGNPDVHWVNKHY